MYASDLKAVILLPDGRPTPGVPVYALDQYVDYKVNISIISALYICVPVIMSSVLCAVSGFNKSVQFWLFQTNFLFSFLKGALTLASLKSESVGLLSVMAPPLVERTNSEVSVNVAGYVFSALLAITLLATLVGQVAAGYGDLKPYKRWTIVGTCTLACFPCVLTMLWVCVVGSLAAQGQDRMANTDMWAYRARWSTFAAATAFCSAVLCARLYYVNRARTKLGIQASNPLKVLLIMTLQNSVIPAVVSIVTAATEEHVPVVLDSCVFLITTTFLPMGFIWAKIRRLNENTRATGKVSMSQTSIYPRELTDDEESLKGGRAITSERSIAEKCSCNLSVQGH